MSLALANRNQMSNMLNRETLIAKNTNIKLKNEKIKNNKFVIKLRLLFSLKKTN